MNHDPTLPRDDADLDPRKDGARPESAAQPTEPSDHPEPPTSAELEEQGFQLDMEALTEEEVLELLEKAREREEYLEKLQRLQAEHENYRKRMNRETANHRLWAQRDLALDILPALDNLERALESSEGTSGKGVEAIREGVVMVRDMLLGALERHGAKPIEALGKPFDPAFHEAVGEMPTEEHAPGRVSAQILKGYTLGDLVIRPSRVLVAAAPPKPDKDDGASDDKFQKP